MSNPYAPKYTADQDLRVRNGRKQLLERWAADKFSAGQPRSFRLEHRTSEIDRSGQLLDVFRASNCSAAFTGVWDAELRRLGFSVEHGARIFEVRVPHQYYLDQRRLPCSVDARCLMVTLASLGMAAFLLAGAVRIGFD